MRKHALLAMIVMSLLLIGCTGGGTVPGPLPNPNPPTDPDEFFDGSPTHLSLVFERDASSVGPMALSTNATTDEVAYVRVIRTDTGIPKKGQVVYSTLKEVYLDPNTSAFSVDNQVPAAKGYYTETIVLRGNELLEVGAMSQIDAPAKTITSVPISVGPPQYTLSLPTELYSGGSLDQIQAKVPDHLNDLIFIYVWAGLNPWEQNGALRPTNNDSQSWIIGAGSGFLPQVTEPTKLYYQVGVAPKAYLVPDLRNWPYHYAPNLDDNEELPYIWIYPNSEWQK